MAPTDIAVTGRGLPGGRAEAKQRDELIIGIDQVAQLSPRQWLVVKVVVAFDVLVKLHGCECRYCRSTYRPRVVIPSCAERAAGSAA